LFANDRYLNTQHKIIFTSNLLDGVRRIRIQLFTLMRIRIQLFTLMGIGILLLIKVMRICNNYSSLQTLQDSILRLQTSIVRVNGPPRLHFEPLKLLNFDFNANADPDPALHSNADPDPASKHNRFNADPDPQPTLLLGKCQTMFRPLEGCITRRQRTHLGVEGVDAGLHEHVGEDEILETGGAAGGTALVIVLEGLEEVCVGLLKLPLPAAKNNSYQGRRYLGFCQGGCTFLVDLPPPPPRIWIWIRIRIRILSWIRIQLRIRIKTMRIHSPGLNCQKIVVYLHCRCRRSWPTTNIHRSKRRFLLAKMSITFSRSMSIKRLFFIYNDTQQKIIKSQVNKLPFFSSCPLPHLFS
jgi:hypothetical protein